MTTKTDNSTTTTTSASNSNNAGFSKYTYETNTNAKNNQNSNDINESINRSLDQTKDNINRSLDQTKDNINRSIDESRNQIPRYNNIVNSYQEQSLQTAKEISEEYIESQKAVIISLQSAWRPYSESFNGLVTNFTSPDSMTKAYTKFVSNFADNAVSAIRLTNNIIFSNLDSWKSTLQQARDNSRHLSNLNVNAARTFEQNSRQLVEANQNNSNQNNSNQNNSNQNNDNASTNKTTYSNTTTTATTKQ
ncbi:MAG: hypothetical protein H0X50_04280 [Nitrosopumilus sp.]|nr:hypothetical protein [Nitrosopumilus sp.]